MIIIFGALILLVFIGIKFRKLDNVDSYLDKDHTTSIIGVFAIIIFFKHFFPYVPETAFGVLDTPALWIGRGLGQLVVVPFLFFSGYGIFEQYKKKGVNYVKSLPKNRILKSI